MLLAEGAAMPFTKSEVPACGLVTTLQAVPFQCSMSGAYSADGAGLLVPSPTAQTLLAEIAATPFSLLINGAGLGLDTTLQAVPFQCSTRVGVKLGTKPAP